MLYILLRGHSQSHASLFPQKGSVQVKIYIPSYVLMASTQPLGTRQNLAQRALMTRLWGTQVKDHVFSSEACLASQRQETVPTGLSEASPS